MAREIEEILAELREYREELVHKNYPMGKINEIIMKWENKSVKELNNDDDIELTDDTYYDMDPLGEED
tara:strand:- start:1119 stop:1322 length:204 start_codon:yes stop_codon:yes gene_type:complete